MTISVTISIVKNLMATCLDHVMHYYYYYHYLGLSNLIYTFIVHFFQVLTKKTPVGHNAEKSGTSSWDSSPTGAAANAAEDSEDDLTGWDR